MNNYLNNFCTEYASTFSVFYIGIYCWPRICTCWSTQVSSCWWCSHEESWWKRSKFLVAMSLYRSLDFSNVAPLSVSANLCWYMSVILTFWKFLTRLPAIWLFAWEMYVGSMHCIHFFGSTPHDCLSCLEICLDCKHVFKVCFYSNLLFNLTSFNL